MRSWTLTWMAGLALLVACGENDFDGDGIDNEEDCEPLDASALSGGTEVCDGVDNDCDGEIDEEATDFATFYGDQDGDRYGNAEDSVQACAAPDGYVAAAGDCDDGDAEVNEGAVEICNDKDDDCNGSIDEGDAAPRTFYADTDGDAWGDPDAGVEACAAPAGHVAVDGDCDDASATVHPGAIERCNDIDDDCNEEVDDGAVDKLQWFQDSDGDTWGAGDGTRACNAPDETWVLTGGDCADDNADVYPTATEVCDETDNDCDTHVDEGAVDANTYYRDADGDRFGWADVTMMACAAPSGFVTDDTDCDDLDISAYPGGTEVCDGADNDCNGSVDDDASDALTWYLDSDGDGAGDPDTSTVACEAPTGYVANDLDCDDSDGTIYDGCFADGGVVMETCGATGRTGPTQSQCDSEYSGTDLEGNVTVSGGIQTLTFPAGGKYGITVRGAAGDSPTSSYAGGKGAEVYGEFTFSRGDTIRVVVGQMGSATGTSGNGGGGGGSFVVNSSGTALLVAGGGGGTRAAATRNGCDAVTSNYGTTASGSNGSGSGACRVKSSGLRAGGIVSSRSYGGGGAGLTGNGAADSPWGTAASSFTNGATGGNHTSSCSSRTGEGGFGGGGAGAGCWGGGGGGGYSGGDGGHVAGGGGSYVSGSNTKATAGVETGDGSVTIEAL